MKRREFVRLGLTGFAGLASGSKPKVPIPRVNGGVNVQPVRRLDINAGFTPPLIVPELVDSQMRALYELGFEHVRLTISFNRFGPDFIAAIPYVRASRALGMDVLGTISQFTGFDLVRTLSRNATRDEVLETYDRIFGGELIAASKLITPGRFSAQILNEPTLFLGISPEVYVREYLRPAYYHLKEDDPGITIVSAAAIGSAEGLLRTRRMIETGLEHFCDRVALHIYGTRSLSALRSLTEKPIWVTESGVAATDRHFEWITETFDLIRSEIPQVERMFWYDLFDLQPGGFRLIDLVPAIDGSFEPVAESAATVAYLEERVAAALGGSAAATYRDLVPDIELYLPTEEDFRLIRSTSIGSTTWPS
jgi:hypothetical protein